jgi:hypothetical protein
VLRLSRRDDPAKDRLFWAWKTSRETAAANFGDPTTITTYSLCVYDAAGALKLSATAPPGGTCLGQPCWKPLRHGSLGSLRYLDVVDRTRDGLSQIVLKRLPSGRVKLLIHGSGINLAVPEPAGGQLLRHDTAVIVQLLNDAGECWETRYAPAAIQNRTELFKDKCGTGRHGGC